MSAILSIKAIHKTFEAGTINENHVLRGLSLDVEEGDFISVIGGNGAGKSTLMNTLAGTLSLDQGDILLEENQSSIYQQLSVPRTSVECFKTLRWEPLHA